MHYPWWYVPFLTAPMLIALIATIHVLVSHYAVGGGLFLALETRHAYRSGNNAYLAYLHRHAWFFVLLTIAFGAITGVGIWWTIGLTSPLATEVLIHAFVFGWAMEYVFFILELTAAFVFYYFWGRLDPRTHLQVGYIYAFSAFMSLVLITGITAFMLNPGDWPQNRTFWNGFFNPQFLPQVLARTGGSILLASLYVYFHAALREKDEGLKRLIEARSARPAIWGSLLLIVGGASWFLFLPESSRAALAGAATLNVLMVIIFALTAVVMLMLYLGPIRNPGWLSPGFAIFFLGFGLAATTTGEYIREAVRKPYILYNVVMGNQILADEIPHAREAGYLESGQWTRAYVADKYPQLLDGQQIDETRMPNLPREAQLDLGELLFMYHCNDCHASGQGLSAVAHLTRGWTPQLVRYSVTDPEKMHFFMPPWAGRPEEAELLARWIEEIREEAPPGMYFGEESGQTARGGLE